MQLLLSGKTKQTLKAIKQTPGGSYLFIGPEAVGKYTTAHYLSEQLCNDPAAKLLVEPEPKKASIGIEQVTDLGRLLHLKTTGSEHRLVIVRGGELLTREAQNAFLKTLEEPPADTTIILTSTNTDNLLPTILSRCKKISFPLLKSQLIADYLRQQRKVGGREAQQLAELSGGAIGQAITLAEQPQQRQALEQRQQLATQFVEAPLYEKLQLVPQIISETTALAMIGSILQILRRRLRQAVTNGESAEVSALTNSMQSGEELLRYLEGNGNAKFALDRLALELGP